MKKLRCSCNKGEICTIQVHDDQLASDGIPLPIAKSDLNKILDNGVANCKIDTMKVGNGVFDFLNSAIDKGQSYYNKGKEIYNKGKNVYNQGKQLYKKHEGTIKKAVNTGRKVGQYVRSRRGRGGWETLIADSKNAYDEYADLADHEAEEELLDTLRGNRRSMAQRRRAARRGYGGIRPGNGVGKDILGIATHIVKSLNAKYGKGAGDDEKIQKVMEVLNKAGNPANQAATAIASSLGKYRMNKAVRLQNRLDRQENRQERILDRITTRRNKRTARKAKRTARRTARRSKKF